MAYSIRPEREQHYGAWFQTLLKDWTDAKDRLKKFEEEQSQTTDTEIKQRLTSKIDSSKQFINIRQYYLEQYSTVRSDRSNIVYNGL